MGKEWRYGLGNLIYVRVGVFPEFYDFGLGSMGLVGVEIWGVLWLLRVKMCRDGKLGREWFMKESCYGLGNLIDAREDIPNEL